MSEGDDDSAAKDEREKFGAPAPARLPPTPPLPPRPPPPLPRDRHSSPAGGPLGAPPPPPPPAPPPRSVGVGGAGDFNRVSQVGSAPLPTPEGFMSTAAKMSLADVALALRDEQLEAKVIHYKADLETNAELDAITAQVITELQNLQAAARANSPVSRPPPPADRSQVEIELIQNLKDMLARVFRPNKLATLIERKLGEVAKRFARLFFESELAANLHKSDKDESKPMRFADQAMYHALHRSQAHIFALLESFPYAQQNVKDRARESYYTLVKNLRNDFLARTTPELNQLVKFLNEVLTKFFTEELPPALGDLSWETVKEARLAESRVTPGYKISASTFPRFRQAFERKFLQRLVPFVEDEMLKRVRETMDQFRSETIRLVADPAIFSDVCAVICDAVYDMLYNDGFLDLPSDWRRRLAAGES